MRFVVAIQGFGNVVVCTECPNLPVVGIRLLAWTKRSPSAGHDLRPSDR
jgi:hypothetical protein